MSHLRGVFAEQDTVISAAKRFEFDAQGNQTNSYSIGGMGADVNMGVNPSVDNTFDPSM